MNSQKYTSTWESIKNHQIPNWFKKAKFGIFAHWGIYSVPATGPNVTWYPYWMYRKPCDHAYCFEITRRENF
tara:strand:+ start:377 stop:592 length:216 start_codon:yes stop_codon:yes gene_type:complete